MKLFRAILDLFGLALRRDLEEAIVSSEFYREERRLLSRQIRASAPVAYTAALMEAADLCRHSPQELAEGGWGSEGEDMALEIRTRILQKIHHSPQGVPVHDALPR